jgi:hypothetical protein
MARGYRPGRTAKSIINGVGDIDISQIGPDARTEVLNSLEEAALADVRVAGDDAGRRHKTRLAALDRWLSSRSERRERRNAPRADRLLQARLWRAIGIYEKTPHIDLPSFGRLLAYLFLAGLDFYVFAEAWAVGANTSTGQVEWWVGGLIGLVVFGAGFLAAIQIKREIVAVRQRELLREVTEPDPRLVLLAQPRRLTIAAIAFFLVMIVLGIAVRAFSPFGGYSAPMILLAALVPMLAAMAEVFLHDPMDRPEAKPSLIDRLLLRRQAKVQRKLEIIEERKENALEQVRKMYEADRRILAVEQHDLGVR